jgi:hypothetical protein
VYDLGANPIQFPRRETLVTAQRYGPQPILADFIIALNVHMFRLVAVEAVKVEPERKPSAKRLVNLAIRLPLLKHRRFRAAVVEEGLSIQRVTESLIDQWIETRERGGARVADLRGFLRGSDVLELRRAERQAELERERGRM